MFPPAFFCQHYSTYLSPHPTIHSSNNWIKVLSTRWCNASGRRRASKCCPFSQQGGECDPPLQQLNLSQAGQWLPDCSLATVLPPGGNPFYSPPGDREPGCCPPGGGGLGSPAHLGWRLPGNLGARAQLSIPVCRAFPGPSSAGPAFPPGPPWTTSLIPHRGKPM